MNLRALTDEEFLRRALAVQDPLTRSEIEAESLRRFEALLDMHDFKAYELVTERELDASVLRETLDTLDTHDIEPGALAQLCNAMLIGPTRPRCSTPWPLPTSTPPNPSQGRTQPC